MSENGLWHYLAFCVEVTNVSGQSTLLENRRQAEANCNNKLFQLFPNVCSDEVTHKEML